MKPSTTNPREKTSPIRQFSQGSLQAYVDCQRLFQLRYLERLSWPAPEIEPSLENEHYLQRGSIFHNMAHQLFSGVPKERLAHLAAQDVRLNQWWINFIDYYPIIDGYTLYPEISLTTPIGEHRLVAKYDLIAVKTSPVHSINEPASFGVQGEIENQAVFIFDWKTSRFRPKQSWQTARLQSRVYPYILVKAGAKLLGSQHLEPGRITMIYWFSKFPNQPMQFSYSKARFNEDEAFLLGVVEEINNIQSEEELPKTTIIKRCQYCVYRSLCDRGVSAGILAEFDPDIMAEGSLDDLSLDIDFEQIAEIEF